MTDDHLPKTPDHGPKSLGYSAAALVPSRVTPTTAPTDQLALKKGPSDALADTPRPNTIPHRPKGQLFVATLLLAVFLLVGYTIWDVYYRYEAFGVVVGQIVDVPATVDGVVTAVHVRSGDQVSRGQLLLELDNIKLRQRRRQLEDELAVARADLAAGTARLERGYAGGAELYYEAVSEYGVLQSRLAEQRAKLLDLEKQLIDLKTLREHDAATRRELESIQILYDGQKSSVEHLNVAVADLKKRVDESSALVDRPQDTLAPLRQNILRIQRESGRIDAQLARCQIRSPLDGVVLDVLRVAGEYCRISDALVSIPDEQSFEGRLFLRQRDTNRLSVDDRVEVTCEPCGGSLAGTVTRVESQYVAAPPSIERQYRKGEHLLSVYLALDDSDHEDHHLRLGQIIKF